MMKQRKKIPLLLMMSLLAMGLSACGGSDDESSNDNTDISVATDGIAVLGDSTTLTVTMPANNLNLASAASETKVELQFDKVSDGAKFEIEKSADCNALTNSNSCTITITPNSEAETLTGSSASYTVSLVDTEGKTVASSTAPLSIKALDISAPSLSKNHQNTYDVVISNNTGKEVDLSDGMQEATAENDITSFSSDCGNKLDENESCNLSITVDPQSTTDFIYTIKNDAGNDFLFIPINFTDQYVKVYWPDWATYDNAIVDPSDPNYNPFDEGYQPSDIPVGRVDEIVYAFAQVGNCAAPFATDSNPTLCNIGAYATGKQDYKLYALDPYSDFATIPDDGSYLNGGDTGKGNMKSVLALKNSNSKLKVILSIGGYTLSTPLFIAMNDEKRTAFVASIIDFLEVVSKDAGQTFDGIDIDWEPNENGWTFVTNATSDTAKQDAYNQLQDYLDLLIDLKAALAEKYGQGSKITGIALPANVNIVNAVENIYPGFWKAMSNSVDAFNLMSYDYHGLWDTNPTVTNFNSPLYFDNNQPTDAQGRDIFNVDSSIEAYISHGIDAQKLYMGIPAYGSTYPNVTSNTDNGLYQSYDNGGSSSFTISKDSDGKTYLVSDTGALLYRQIMNSQLNNNLGYSWNSLINTDAYQVTAYEPNNQWFISYDSPATIEEKGRYARNKGLGGLMMWDISGDIKSSESAFANYSLAKAMDES
ncbi:MAG: glycoside hydrolase family 18 protein [Francisellaceae bacterium]